MNTALGTLLLTSSILVAPGPPQIPWFDGPFSNALGRAREEESLVAVYFWTEGSEYCQRMFQETLSTPEGGTELAGMVCYSADVAAPQGARLVQRFGVSTLPTVLFVTGEGHAEDVVIGFAPLPAFRSEVQRIVSGQGTVRTLRRLAAEAPDDLQRRFDLGVKLQDVGLADEGDALFASIRADDPDGTTLVGAQLHLWEVQNAITAAAPDPTDPRTWDLEPMIEHLPAVSSGPIAFQGWNWVADIEAERGRRREACAAYETAWAHIPDTSVWDWGFKLVDVYWGLRDELTASDRAFVREVGEAVWTRVEALVDAEPEDRFGMDDESFRSYRAEVLELLSRALWLSGDTPGAVAAVEQAIELSPKEGAYRARLEFFQ